MSNIGDIISGVESERTGSKFTKRKRKCLCCVRKFHVAVGRDRRMVIQLRYYVTIGVCAYKKKAGPIIM